MITVSVSFPPQGGRARVFFGRAAGCLSDSEFLPVWKKYPGVADTMIKAGKSLPMRYLKKVSNA
ncbi:MAG: hypothetical protein V1852_28065 [Pseudomonadota bacterium]